MIGCRERVLVLVPRIELVLSVIIIELDPLVLIVRTGN